MHYCTVILQGNVGKYVWVVWISWRWRASLRTAVCKSQKINMNYGCHRFQPLSRPSSKASQSGTASQSARPKSGKKKPVSGRWETAVVVHCVPLFVSCLFGIFVFVHCVSLMFVSCLFVVCVFVDCVPLLFVSCLLFLRIQEYKT